MIWIRNFIKIILDLIVDNQRTQNLVVFTPTGNNKKIIIN